MERMTIWKIGNAATYILCEPHFLFMQWVGGDAIRIINREVDILREESREYLDAFIGILQDEETAFRKCGYDRFTYLKMNAWDIEGEVSFWSRIKLKMFL